MRSFPGPVRATIESAMANNKDTSKKDQEKVPERNTAADAAERQGRSEATGGAKSGGDKPISEQNKRSTAV